MSLLAFNANLDRWKHRLLSVVGGTEYRDHLLRAQLSYVDFALTAAQLDTLNATPVTVLAAPASGYIYLVDSWFVKVLSTGLTRMELGSGTLRLQYTDGSGTEAATAVTNTVVESATDALFVGPGAAIVPVAAAALVVSASADVTSGTATVRGRIWYRRVKIDELVAS